MSLRLTPMSQVFHGVLDFGGRTIEWFSSPLQKFRDIADFFYYDTRPLVGLIGAEPYRAAVNFTLSAISARVALAVADSLSSTEVKAELAPLDYVAPVIVSTAFAVSSLVSSHMIASKEDSLETDQRAQRSLRRS